MDFIEPCFGIGHNLSLICQMTSEDIKLQLIMQNHVPRSTHIPRPNHVPATHGLLADHVCAYKSCVCGGVISFHHVLFNCRESSAHFAPITSSLTSLGLPLCVRSLALRHRQSWSLLRAAAAKLVYSCPVAAYL